MAFRKLAARLKLADGPLDIQFAPPIPGLPLVVKGTPGSEERFPGMRRWVSREMLERAMAAQARGDVSEFAEDEQNYHLRDNAVTGGTLGALTGALLARKSPLQSALLGALVGGGAGTLAHMSKRTSVERDAREALLGAQRELAQYPREQTALPQNRQDESSAAAVAPTLLHTAPSVAY